MKLLESIGGKILTGVIALAVIIAGYTWFTMDPTTRSAIVSNTGKGLGWIALVAVLPWAGFFLVAKVNQLRSNAASIALIVALTILEAALLLYAFGFSTAGGWTFASVAIILAGAYNLLACDFIADRLEK